MLASMKGTTGVDFSDCRVDGRTGLCCVEKEHEVMTKVKVNILIIKAHLSNFVGIHSWSDLYSKYQGKN